MTRSSPSGSTYFGSPPAAAVPVENSTVKFFDGGDVVDCVPDKGRVRVASSRRGGENKRVRGEGEIDYKTFLDLVLAMENKQTRQVGRERGCCAQNTTIS